MAERYGRYFIGLTCDAQRCGAELGADEVVGESETAFWRVAAELGWTAWRSRGTRVYCPAHGPREGHRMENITRWKTGEAPHVQ